MRRYLTILVSLAILATVLLPATSAGAQATRAWIPPGSDCHSLVRFQLGCEISGGPWSDTFADYAEENGIAPWANVGARVQYFPQGSQPLEEVLYIVGPYLPAIDESMDQDSVTEERRSVAEIAPVIGDLEVRLRDLNVSVVYIGFGSLEDSQQPVAQRVQAVKSTIRAFETRRESTLGREPHATALIGISLGGVAGKIALNELESEGFDHGVETYISFDSPHGGAYTPIGLQFIPVFLEAGLDWIDGNVGWLADLVGNDGLSAGRDDAAQVTNLALRSPVSQDLLIVNVGYPDLLSPNYSYVQDRYRDLPATTRNVAISSGSTTGRVLSNSADFLSFDTGDSSGSTLDTRLEMTVSSPTFDDHTVFSGKLSHKGLTNSGTFIPYPEWKTVSFTADGFGVSRNLIENAERAPCATNPEIVETVVEQLNTALNEADLWRNLNIRATNTEACFIPTWSATIGSPGNGGPVVGRTAFDHVIGNAENKEHLAVSGNMANELLSEIDRVFATSPASSQPNQTAPLPVTEPQPVAAAGCDFWSGTHNLDDTRAMFPEQCGTNWNDQVHRCDYTNEGWHCMDINPGPTNAVATVIEQVVQAAVTPATQAGCDFWSGTHNLDDTRAMFPEQCGTNWNDQLHRCDYTNEGWHCMDI